ncbi:MULTISPECIES: C40 family peptidase [Streptosporangium]|uniref:Cell wall-associated NlpC family hydrolase n=1 Tax=Streptosporangium brasiliense TaxID=47480 RepID=A0ABT9R7L6_9ACTN|nr:NlpC/P60 family protein [Streptosporangium brasiliense]MDP9864400.1 cell wall-associated NlpC family hydrolase [Streptosporangium brasiliense]
MTVIGLAFASLTLGTPLVSATADPQPGLQELAKQVEKLHTEIETLTEQYNGGRVKLKQAQRAAASAKKTLAVSESELAARRTKASLLAQSNYMSGGLGSTLAFTQSADPDTFLDLATTSYALQQQQNEEVAQVAQAIKAAERAQAGAKARTAEVKDLLSDIGAKRTKIERLVTRVESDLFSEVRSRAKTTRGNRVKISVPVVGSGKAAEAARWALSQQLKPYVWGAEGPNSFDCSGLVMWAYQKVGISLPHYTGDQWTAGTHISKEQLRPGDLVFFYSDLHHVGIYIGAGLMVHAPQTGDVIHIASIENRPFAGGVRVAD